MYQHMFLQGVKGYLTYLDICFDVHLLKFGLKPFGSATDPAPAQPTL